jgi:DNA-binding response OmpR family regulator
LLVSPRVEDHNSLKNIFRGSRWQVQGAWTASDGLKVIHRNHPEIPVVICEHNLPDGDWKLLLAALDNSAVRPSFIVCSRLADERLWVEVLNLGAFDLLLCAPFVPEEVLRVTESAWSAWKSAVRLNAVPRKAPGLARIPAYSGALALAAGSHF